MGFYMMPEKMNYIFNGPYFFFIYIIVNGDQLKLFLINKQVKVITY